METPIRNQPLPYHFWFQKEGQTYLLSGAQSMISPTSRIFVLGSNKKISDALKLVGRQILGFGLSQLILGLLIGVILTRHFLLPIKELGSGLQAMRKRNFHHRVPVTSNDEFGQLTENFNQLMAGMGDLEVAKIVHDSFFPNEPIIEAGWEIFGSSESAGRVGGDYFDYSSLPDGRWMLVVGDVSGHGVSAALVVAMVKALIFLLGQDRTPEDLLAHLNTSLSGILKRKKMMSCLLGFFTPKTGELRVANAGHCYPYLFSHGIAQELKTTGLPLGVKWRKPLTGLEIRMKPGESVVFYTDGLVEAKNKQETQIGYEVFSDVVPGLIGKTAAQSVKNIRAWQNDIMADPANLEDDITLVILQHS